MNKELFALLGQINPPESARIPDGFRRVKVRIEGCSHVGQQLQIGDTIIVGKAKAEMLEDMNSVSILDEIRDNPFLSERAV